MAQPGQSPYRLFLVVDPFREVLPQLPTLLGPLTEVDPYLPGIEGFYDDQTDAALIGLKFHRRAAERIGPNLLIDLVSDCNLPVIAPEELSEEQYEAFYGLHLPIYPIRVKRQQGEGGTTPLVQQVVEALAEKVANVAGDATVPEVDFGPHFGADIRVRPGTGVDVEAEYESIELEIDQPVVSRPRHERPSSRWELDLDDFELDGEDRGRPSSQWELVL